MCKRVRECVLCVVFLLLTPNLLHAFPGSVVDVLSVPVQSNPNDYPQIVAITTPSYSGSVYAGPYPLYVPASAITVSWWMCFDANIEIVSSWTALLTNTSTAEQIYQSAGVTNAAAIVDEIAWLANQFGPGPATTTTAAINLAMWEIYGQGTVSSTTYDVSSWVTAAQAHASDSTSADFLIPISCNSSGDCSVSSASQPFVAPDPVPEPGTLLLLGSGIVGLGMVLRRRVKS